MSKFENLYGGMKIEVVNENGFEMEEFSISIPMMKYFVESVHNGKFTLTKKGFGPDLEILNCQLERCWADMVAFKKACQENPGERGEACKKAYKSVAHCLIATGTIPGYAPATSLLTVAQWHVFADALSYRAGKKVGDACKVTSLTTFKRAVISALFNHASGRETLENLDNAKIARIESNLRNCLAKAMRPEVLA